MDPNNPPGQRARAHTNALPEQRESVDRIAEDRVHRRMMEMLETPRNAVYTLSADGQTYIAPRLLRGVPVAPLAEQSLYWEESWDSLAEYIEQEPEEERLKQENRQKLVRDPGNKNAQAQYKLHSDNVSKQRKIREIFGPNTVMHPNQLVAKLHLPSEGLCQKELMYRLACKISDLQVLRDKGDLVMDPWDFIRWRISVKAESFLSNHLSSAKDNLRTIIYKITEAATTETAAAYEDTLLRKAVLRSAAYQGRLSSYSATRSKPANKVVKITKLKAASRPATANSRSSAPSRVPHEQERRASKQKQTERPIYQGVNAFRAQKQNKI